MGKRRQKATAVAVEPGRAEPPNPVGFIDRSEHRAVDGDRQRMAQSRLVPAGISRRADCGHTMTESPAALWVAVGIPGGSAIDQWLNEALERFTVLNFSSHRIGSLSHGAG